MSELTSIRRIAIVAKRVSQEALATAAELAGWLRRRGVEVAIDDAIRDAHQLTAYGRFTGDGNSDLIVVLGGDGTMLSVGRSLEQEVPLLGVNLGNLGFLTDVRRSELYPAIVNVLEGRFEVEARALLDVILYRTEGESERFRVLNDAVINKSALARIIELAVDVDDRRVTAYRSDGLIISTPTGSTAYNLSADGPILSPKLPVVVLTPICPHTLSQRPVVVSESSAITVSLQTEHEEVYLTLDGQEGTQMAVGDRVEIRRAVNDVLLVKVSGRSFYDNLRDKLRWGE